MEKPDITNYLFYTIDGRETGYNYVEYAEAQEQYIKELEDKVAQLEAITRPKLSDEEIDKLGEALDKIENKESLQKGISLTPTIANTKEIISLNDRLRQIEEMTSPDEIEYRDQTSFEYCDLPAWKVEKINKLAKGE
jgi:hypothetical protein